MRFVCYVSPGQLDEARVCAHVPGTVVAECRGFNRRPPAFEMVGRCFISEKKDDLIHGYALTVGRLVFIRSAVSRLVLDAYIGAKRLYQPRLNYNCKCFVGIAMAKYVPLEKQDNLRIHHYVEVFKDAIQSRKLLFL